MNYPYDPEQYRTPPEGNDAAAAPCPPHTHTRRYDRGLITPPISVARSGRFILALVACSAVAFLGAFLAIGRASDASCLQREELAEVLRGQIAADDKALLALGPQINLTAAQIQDLHKQNQSDIRKLRFAPC